MDVMKPVSRDTPDPPARPPRPPLPPAGGRRARRGGSGVRAVVAGVAMLMIVVAGFALLRPGAPPPRAAETPQISRPAVGTIKFFPEGNSCRQATIDNKTGEMTELGRGRCDDAKGGGHPGGRL